MTSNFVTKEAELIVTVTFIMEFVAERWLYSVSSCWGKIFAEHV